MIPAATGLAFWLISILTIAACIVAAREDHHHTDAEEGESK